MNFDCSCIIILIIAVILLFDDRVEGTGELEVVILPIDINDSTVPLNFTAFGKNVDLLLRKNENLLADSFEVWRRDDKNLSKLEDFSGKESSSCHYLYKDPWITAAVSLCDSKSMHGFVFFENESFEIRPLTSDEDESTRSQVRSSSSLSSAGGEPHVIRKRRILPNVDTKMIVEASPRDEKSSSNSSTSNDKNSLTIELAVFLDAAAYALFVPQVAANAIQLLDTLLAYVNNIQALYHHPSLGHHIDLALVRLELMAQQPPELANLDGERSRLLDTFCAYSKAINPPDDGDPRHWDIGLYVSGLDFYALEQDGQRNPITMGLAPVGGVCWPDYSCVIAEFGVTNRFGKPYPSAGFTSIYIAAHEIAHNLGMHHDSVGNDCPRDGYIMSPSRGTEGETQWSNCSRAIASRLVTEKPCLLDEPGTASKKRRLDHGGRFGGRPGRSWTAKRQCELLLRDPEAVVDTLEDCCRALRCRSPERTGFYLAGPALDGTKCSEDGNECRAGECLPIDDKWVETPVKPRPSSSSPRASGWSEWKEEKCESGCIRGSLGYLARRRTCLGEVTCPGLNFDVNLCKDSRICELSQRKRVSVEEFAGRRCLEYADLVPEIARSGGGMQARHEDERPWVGCAVFCKMRDVAAPSYYSPRLELNDLGVDPYFPDGTWCHKDDQGENYFCRRHHCLPENFRFGKGLPAGIEDEERLGPMNAGPRDWRPHPDIAKYFGLGMDGRPLLTSLGPRLLEDAGPPRDGESWLDSKDYVEFLFRHPQQPPPLDSL